MAAARVGGVGAVKLLAGGLATRENLGAALFGEFDELWQAMYPPGAGGRYARRGAPAVLVLEKLNVDANDLEWAGCETALSRAHGFAAALARLHAARIAHLDVHEQRRIWKVIPLQHTPVCLCMLARAVLGVRPLTCLVLPPAPHRLCAAWPSWTGSSRKCVTSPEQVSSRVSSVS